MLLRSRVSRAVHADAAARGFRLDRDQRRLLAALDRAEGGVYAWGPSGRGKTWVLDRWFEHLPTERKARVHVHRFFRDLHERLFANRSSLAAAIDELLDGVDVLYFDEFHVHDPGDATLLVPVLRAVFERNVMLLTSSNDEPGAERHPLLQPGIDLVLERAIAVGLTGPVDHRGAAAASDRGFAAGRWLRVDELASLGLELPDAASVAAVQVRDRLFPVRAARDGVLWLSFEQLAGRPTSAIEYLAWAADYPTWVVTDVPDLSAVGPEVQQRWITAVDVLCDTDTRLVVCSEVSRDDFLASAGGRPDSFRMTSRLRLLR